MMARLTPGTLCCASRAATDVLLNGPSAGGAVAITAVGCARASDVVAAAARPPSTSRRCRFAMLHLSPAASLPTYK
jgi:hypothetical protein